MEGHNAEESFLKQSMNHIYEAIMDALNAKMN